MARRKPKTRGYNRKHVAMAVLGFPAAGASYGLSRVSAHFYKKPSTMRTIREMLGPKASPAMAVQRARRVIRSQKRIAIGAAGIGAYGLGRILAAKFRGKKRNRRKR